MKVVTCDVCGCQYQVPDYELPLDICMACIYEEDASEQEPSETDD